MVQEAHLPRKLIQAVESLEDDPADDRFIDYLQAKLQRKRGDCTSGKLRKQISIFISLSDWKLIRAEASRLGLANSQLCRAWIIPYLETLRKRRKNNVKTT